MSKNQKGFTYPLTLAILITFLIFFSIQVQQLLTERKMHQETKIILQQEYYMLTTVKKMEGKLQSGDLVETKGTFQFLNGYVDYQADLPSGSTQKITFTLHLHSGETAVGFGYFDKNLKKLVKWIEKN
ncbi:competence type IV pilus minor pilin ComGG [Bacillus sp. EB600]|uniref:competence type IV pilus minor pilin ComGG n=1 Tax=Bacillus sp. EB600 TaxID=2806345 RepID=UPI00210E9D32|nr:competence type IV pilus minor pilin ComGG [Bacillus sp. EB600]MCQ6278085.1 hypothetical protein [Bacillus sp. EB600]